MLNFNIHHCIILSGVPPRSRSALPRAFGALLQKFDYAQDDRRDGVELRRCVRSIGETRDSKILFEIPTLRVALRVRLAIKLLAQDDTPNIKSTHYLKEKMIPLFESS